MHVLRSEEQNAAYIDVLYAMEEHEATWTPEEAEMADLLTLLIENFEEQHYGLPRAAPVDAITMLMEQQGLLPNDLSTEFGSADIALEVLTGDRELDKQQIARLSTRFHVSPELFF